MALWGSSAASTAASEASVIMEFLNCGSLMSPASVCESTISVLAMTDMIIAAKSFSKDTIVGFAVKFLDFQDNFLVSVVVFDCPASEIECSNLLRRELLLIIEVGEQHGDSSIRTDESNDPEFQCFEFFSLFLRNLAEEPAAWVNTDLVLFFCALDKSLNRGKSGLSGTSENEIALESSHKIANQLVSGYPRSKSNTLPQRIYFRSCFTSSRSEEFVGTTVLAMGIRRKTLYAVETRHWG